MCVRALVGRFVDPRTATESGSFQPHEGSKSVKLTYLGESDKLATLGFTRQSQRELKIWDPKMTNTPLTKVDIDQVRRDDLQARREERSC